MTTFYCLAEDGVPFGSIELNWEAFAPVAVIEGEWYEVRHGERWDERLAEGRQEHWLIPCITIPHDRVAQVCEHVAFKAFGHYSRR